MVDIQYVTVTVIINRTCFHMHQSFYHLYSHFSPILQEPGDVPQPRGCLGDSWCSQNHRGAAQKGKEAPGRCLFTGGEGEITTHPAAVCQGCHPPPQRQHAPPRAGSADPGSLQYFAIGAHSWRGPRRRRAKGKMQGSQFQPVQQEYCLFAHEGKREFKTHSGVRWNTRYGGASAGSMDCHLGDSVHICLFCVFCVPVCVAYLLNINFKFTDMWVVDSAMFTLID